MVKHIAKYQLLIKTILGLTSVVCIGIYINRFSITLENNTHNVITSIPELGWYNMYPIAFIVSSLLLFYMESIPNLKIKNLKKDLFKCILASACEAFKRGKSFQIRAHVTLCNHKKNVRVTEVTYNTLPNDPENRASFQLDFGVTGKAYNTRDVHFEELPEDHYTKYPPDVKQFVSKDIKSIIAIPLFDPIKPEGPLFGMLTFDSRQNLKETGFDKHHHINDLLRSYANLIVQLLKA